MEGSGIQYPTIEIAGKTYTVKFSRAAFYRLGKAGFDLRQFAPLKDGLIAFSILFDLLHAAIADQLPVKLETEELVDMALPIDMPHEAARKRLEEIGSIVREAFSKIAPPPQLPLRETAATLTERPQ